MPAKGVLIVMLKWDGLIRTITRDGSTGSYGDRKIRSGVERKREELIRRQAYLASQISMMLLETVV